MANLDPVTIAVTTQLKLVFAAFFSVVLLRHQMHTTRWLAVVLMIVGLTLLQRLPDSDDRRSLRAHHHAPESPLGTSEMLTGAHAPARAPNGVHEPDRMKGFVAMVGVCSLSGLAGVITER